MRSTSVLVKRGGAGATWMPPRPQTVALPATCQQGTGATRQPRRESQVSSVQRSPSSQESGDPAVQTPLSQRSPTVQGSPTLQGVPSGWSPPPTQAPPDGLQRPSAWQGSRATEHVPVLAPIHWPLWQASLRVHASRSSQAVPSGCPAHARSEEHTSELQSLAYLVCRL